MYFTFFPFHAKTYNKDNFFNTFERQKYSKPYDFAVGNFRLKKTKPPIQSTLAAHAFPSLIVRLLLRKIIPSITIV